VHTGRIMQDCLGFRQTVRNLLPKIRRPSISQDLNPCTTTFGGGSAVRKADQKRHRKRKQSSDCKKMLQSIWDNLPQELMDFEKA